MLVAPAKQLPNPSFESFASLTGTGRLRRPAPQLKRYASSYSNHIGEFSRVKRLHPRPAPVPRLL
jgi:hypothetical protein